MNDLISRAEVINAIKHLTIKGSSINAADIISVLFQLPSASDQIADYCDRLWKIAYQRGRNERPTQSNTSNALDALTPRWIPVSERLPEEYNTVLITVKSRDSKKEPWIYFTDVATYHGCNGIDWETFNDWDEGQEYYITAWMPLPKPWEGEKHE